MHGKLLLVFVFAAVLQIAACHKFCKVCGGQSIEDCRRSSRTIECNPGRRACYTQVKNVEGELFMTKGCRNSNACENQQRKNPRECDSGSVSQTCTFCCSNDECNDRDNFEVAESEYSEPSEFEALENLNCDDWNDWESCSTTCGQGFKRRSRTCLGYSNSRSKSKSWKSSKSSAQQCSKSGACVEQYEYKPCFRNCEDLHCYTCETGEEAVEDPNCVENIELCAVNQPYCKTTLTYEGEQRRVTKQCARTNDCRHLAKRWSETCRALLHGNSKTTIRIERKEEIDEVEGETGYMVFAGNVNNVNEDMALLEEACQFCCIGDLCNEALLPPFDNILGLGASSSLKAAAILVFAIVLCLIIG